MSSNTVEQIRVETEVKAGGQTEWNRRHNLSERAYAIGIWCLILFLSGVVVGVAFAFRYHSGELGKATRLGCLIYDGVTYELRQRGQK